MLKQFDGKLRFALGLPRTGKTSFVIPRISGPHLWVAPGPSNPSIVPYPYVDDTDEGLQYILDNPVKTLALYTKHGNPNIFEVMKSRRRTYVLDEIGNICYNYDLKKRFEMWARQVGWMDGGLEAWCTTQRPSADVPPAVYIAAREIYWIGPLKDQRTAQLLFDNRSVDMDFKDFYERLQVMEKYNWQKPFDKDNLSRSVFKIKEL